MSPSGTVEVIIPVSLAHGDILNQTSDAHTLLVSGANAIGFNGVI